MTAQDISTFSYDNPEQRIVIEQRFSEAQDQMRQGMTSMIEAGRKFSEIRDLLRHNKAGGFDGWMDSKGLTRRTIYRLIEVFDTFGTVPKLAQLDIAASAAFLLASPSTPEPARQQAIQEAATGKRLTHQRAKEIVAANFASVADLADELRTWLSVFEDAHDTMTMLSAGDGILWNDLCGSIGAPFRKPDLRKAIALIAAEYAHPLPAPTPAEPPFPTPPSLSAPSAPSAVHPPSSPEAAIRRWLRERIPANRRVFALKDLARNTDMRGSAEWMSLAPYVVNGSDKPDFTAIRQAANAVRLEIEAADRALAQAGPPVTARTPRAEPVPVTLPLPNPSVSLDLAALARALTGHCVTAARSDYAAGHLDLTLDDGRTVRLAAVTSDGLPVLSWSLSIPVG